MSTASAQSAYEEGLRYAASGEHALAIEHFERALAHAPDDVRVLFALGNTARALGLDRPAEIFYRQVLAQDQDRVEALVNLANLLRARGDFSAAEALLVPALARAPECAEFWLTLGSVYRETGDCAQARRHYERALEICPGYAAALGNLADLIADEGQIDEAIAIYDGVLRTKKGDPQPRLNRAILHFLRGDLKSGWRDYAARLQIPGKVPQAGHGLGRWTGDSLRRRRLLVTAEQGIGDQIMFASIVPDLSRRAQNDGGSIILECEPRLASLFARSFPAVRVSGWDAQTRGGVTRMYYGWLKALGGANAAIEMGSLPRLLRPDLDSFPAAHAYLVPDAAESAVWRGRFGAEPAIGICWRSGKTGGHRAVQYAPLEAWAEFLRGFPGRVVSVQYDATAEEIAALQGLSGREILLPPDIDQKMELDRACALLSALDAVVSAPTAVSWLAAASGTPTLKVLYDRSWTSFGRDYEPFAPACKCISPQSRGDWQDVFTQVQGHLSALGARA